MLKKESQDTDTSNEFHTLDSMFYIIASTNTLKEFNLSFKLLN